jgi:hypothetical protein
MTSHRCRDARTMAHSFGIEIAVHAGHKDLFPR